MIAGLPVAPVYLAAFALSIILFLIFSAFFKYSRLGIAMRATAFDQQAAASMGIGIKNIFALSWCIARAEVEEIDQLNILHATMLAMQRAVAGLHITPRLALIDGNRCPKLAMPAEAVVKGDSKVPAIAAASILAKVSRDREMAAFELQYPGYGIGGHKGYPTAVHLEALERLGPTPIHRRSFGPVRRAYEALEGL